LAWLAKTRGLRLSLLALAAFVAPGAGAAETVVSLRQLNERVAPDFTAALLGQRVIIAGTVNARAYHFPTYTVLTLSDGANGAALEVRNDDKRLDSLQPGDQITASGKVSALAGMTTVTADRITVVGRQGPPVALPISVAELRGFRYLGRLVRVRGQVQGVADTVSGAYLDIAGDGQRSRIFLPRTEEMPAPQLSLYTVGDRVEVFGSAFIYSSRPPYDRGFELLTFAPADIAVVSKHSPVPPWTLLAGMILILAAVLVFWGREHRMRLARERSRKIYSLGEEILSAESGDAILKRLEEALPRILNITRVRLYIHNRSAKTLESVRPATGEIAAISLNPPPAGPQAGAVACFHYRTLLVIPDIARSPFPMAPEGMQPGGPKSLLLVPMMAQGEVIGVLELDQDDRARAFSADEQAMAQHLGNQIGVALRLSSQRSVQEQLFRTEKMAAVGRLISGVINELQLPLASISELAQRVVERYPGPAERELAAIAAEARRAASITARLVSFAGAEQSEAKPLSVGSVLRGLIEFREGDWQASGIRVRDLSSREALTVLGSQGQLEQVFLNLLVHAEQSLAEAPEKTITIRTSVLAKRVLVEISFSAPTRSANPEETATILGVTRSIIAGHGGEVRLIEKPNAEARFEVELPLSSRERAGEGGRPSFSTPAASDSAPAADGARRSMTALLIEPDEAVQRQFMALLSGRGYRVVPVVNADNGLDLAQRIRFDLAFCSVHAPGLNWVELSERMQSRVGAFVLVSEGDDQELAADFEGDGRFVISKPIQQADLARVYRYLDRPAGPAKVIPIKDDVA
jgi:signal transduction histidine kinase